VVTINYNPGKLYLKTCSNQNVLLHFKITIYLCLASQLSVTFFNVLFPLQSSSIHFHCSSKWKPTGVVTVIENNCQHSDTVSPDFSMQIGWHWPIKRRRRKVWKRINTSTARSAHLLGSLIIENPLFSKPNCGSLNNALVELQLARALHQVGEICTIPHR
jgi:hypothetical protein